jgi:hypothetical protein
MMRPLMHLGLFTIVCATAAAFVPAQGQNGRTERVEFPRGSSQSTIHDSIRGRHFVDYLVRAKAGQEIQVVLETDHPSNYFNVYEPGTRPEFDNAIYAGSIHGTSYETALPSDGDYLIRVYLMRSAGRRGETANYALMVAVTGEPNASSTYQAPSALSYKGHLLDWPARIDAKGYIPCSSGDPALDAQCEFRVLRNRSGATIYAVKPGGETEVRVLYFEGEKFMSNDKAELSWTRQNDNWSVAVNGEEFYLIPDALIWGG